MKSVWPKFYLQNFLTILHATDANGKVSQAVIFQEIDLLHDHVQ